MQKNRLVLGLLTVFAWSNGAAETTHYRYDALGRVISVDDRSGSGVGHATALAYDPAGNRAKVQVSVIKFSETYPASNRLNQGESIVSANAEYRFTLQYDGNLVLYDGQGQALWSTGTSTGFHLDMQSDGNLVLYDSAQNPIWYTRTDGHPGAYFVVQVDSNIVVYDANKHPLWARYGL